MTTARLIAFEGVDGAGKTTVLAMVAEALAQNGHRVFLPREGKEHSSHPTRMIRALTRDPRNLDLTARAELALYCAREAQVLDELVRPALARGETVLVDRSFLTPVVLGAYGRGLDLEMCTTMAAAAADGVRTDLTLVFDVHPRTSRIRKRLEKVRTKTLGGGGRKGLAGSGLKERVRNGYLAVAQQNNYPVFHAERVGPADVAERVLAFIEHGKPPSETESPLDAVPNWRVEPGTSLQDGLRQVPPAVALFLTNGLRCGRALREQMFEQEPELCTWALDPEDPLRERAIQVEPEYALRGWSRRPLEGASDLRLQVLEQYPNAVLSSLKYLTCDLSERLRFQYADQEPAGVLVSLVGREDASAVELRRRCWKEAPLEARATSLAFCTSEEAWRLRQKVLAKAPQLAVESLRGSSDERTNQLLELYAEKAPKSVLRALSGRSDAFAHRLRASMVHVGRELVDSIRGLDDEDSWALRERFCETAPSTVLNSLKGLDLNSERVRSVRAQCEKLGAGDLHTLRRSQALDEYAGLPDWVTTRAAISDSDG